MWSPRALVGIGFVMLALTSLQGWTMVGIIASSGQEQSPLMLELKRLHNLGLSGGFLAIAFGLTLQLMPLPESRQLTLCRVLVPSLLVAPLAFCDRLLIAVFGAIDPALQVFIFALQAASALGITVSLALIAAGLLRPETK